MLTRYSRLGASSRLRALQYVPALSKAGFKIDIAPFFDDDYLNRIYADKRVGLLASKYYAARVLKLLSKNKPDLIWIEQEVFPWLPWPIERAILGKKVPLVCDYDDAVFHRYDQHNNKAIRQLLGRKIDGLMARANLVTAGNQYLADRAVSVGARHVEIVPTVVDVETYSTRHLPSDDKRSRIGWIGSPSTWSEFMVPILPTLTSIASEHGATIRAVGADHGVHADPEIENLPWSEQAEIELIQGMDIGIMPLDDSPFARGKCGYKLIQYMACGVPVIASPVGVNSEIVKHGVNGFLVKTEADWINSIETLLRDATMRQRMGEAGRKLVEQKYSRQVFGPKVVKLFTNIGHWEK